MIYKLIDGGVGGLINLLIVIRFDTTPQLFSKFLCSSLQTIKSQHIATVRKLGKPPHLIMRIMDTVLLLFLRKVNAVEFDPERVCMKPSWNESLKVC